MISIDRSHRLLLVLGLLTATVASSACGEAADSGDTLTSPDVLNDVASDTDDATIDDVAPDTDTDTGTDGSMPPFARNVFITDDLVNISHRGGSLLWPEETLLAYESALAAGTDAIECDAHATSDGIVVCMHDATVDRTTDGAGQISAMTFAELRTLDAGYRFSTDGGQTYPHRGAGLKVPSLDEVLAQFAGVPLSVEIKQFGPPIDDALLSVIDSHDAVNSVVVASFSDPVLIDIRSRRPDILTTLAALEMLNFNALTDATEVDYIVPAPIIQAPDSALTPQVMDRAHRLGMRVQVWTVNDTDEMARFLDMGVDGIMTDDPIALKAVMDGDSNSTP